MTNQNIRRELQELGGRFLNPGSKVPRVKVFTHEPYGAEVFFLGFPGIVFCASSNPSRRCLTGHLEWTRGGWITKPKSFPTTDAKVAARAAFQVFRGTLFPQ